MGKDASPLPADKNQSQPSLPPPRPPLPRRVMDPNEIEVLDERREDEYTQRALQLLQDPSLVFLTLIAPEPRLAGVTVKLAEEIKRRRYKASGEELKTFVQQQDQPPQAPVPPSAGRKGYVPPPAPSSLKIFISRMDLGLNPQPKKPEWKPDLRPAINLNAPSPSPSHGSPQARPGAGHFPPTPQRMMPGAYVHGNGVGGPSSPNGHGAPGATGSASPHVQSEKAEERARLRKQHQKR